MKLLKEHVAHYRPDIDGLRALAVSMVVLFHFWPKILRGGFIGVDIFFVISGFLITSIIYREKLSGVFSFKSFYLRRIKRILPAFFVMLFLTYVLAYFLLLPEDLVIFSKNASCASLYFSNICFMGGKSYFAVNSTENPILHTWSLGVEEQYYLLWPLLLFISMKLMNKKGLYVLFTALLFSSLFFAIYCLSHNVKVGYYSVFSRAFELLLGSITALYLMASHKHNEKNSPFVTKFSRMIGIVGLLFIVFSCFLLSEHSPFPGYYALIPTIGSVMIIYAGHVNPRAWVSRFLSKKIMVRVGLLSYSLYLFHWPVISFWRYLSSQSSPSYIAGPLLLMLIVSISILTHKYIEVPFKLFKLSLTKSFICYQLVPMLLVLVMYGLVENAEGWPKRISLKLHQENTFLPEKYCFDKNNHGDCIFGAKAQPKPRVLFFGDSHAAQFFPFMDEVAKKYGFSIKMIAISRCYPLLDTVNTLPSTDESIKISPSCPGQIQYVTTHYKDFDVFILGGSYKNYINLKHEKDADSMHPQSFDFLPEFGNTIDFLTSHGKKVLVVGDVPHENEPRATYLIRRQAAFGEEGYDAFKKSMSVIYDTDANNAVKALTESYKNTYFFNSYEQLFYPIKTLPFYKDVVIYRNYSHLNMLGSTLLAQYYLSLPDNEMKNKLAEWGIIQDIKAVQ